MSSKSMERRRWERESVCAWKSECVHLSLIKKNDKCLEEIETFVSENEVTFFVWNKDISWKGISSWPKIMLLLRKDSLVLFNGGKEWTYK